MILLNKPKYLTSLQTLKLFQHQDSGYKSSKLGYCGTLDPMATGLLLVLVDEENKRRSKYIGLTKTYEFEFITGITTDTGDLLGIPTKTNKQTNTQNLKTLLPKLIGKYNQQFPDYSSKIINGQRMYKLARENKLQGINVPSYERKIQDIKLLKTYKVRKKDILEEVYNMELQVKGDFRQKNIKNAWENFKFNDNDFIVFKLFTTVSSGTYIRQLVFDIATRLNTCAFSYNIKRTKVGNFNLANAIKI